MGVDEGRQGWGRKREKWRSRGLEKGQKMRIYIEVGAPMRRRAAAYARSSPGNERGGGYRLDEIPSHATIVL